MATIITYSLERDGENYALKSNGQNSGFKIKEFACKDGTDIIKICTEIIDILEEIKTYFNKPIVINSAYRTPSYNKIINESSNQ